MQSGFFSRRRPHIHWRRRQAVRSARPRRAHDSHTRCHSNHWLTHTSTRLTSPLASSLAQVRGIPWRYFNLVSSPGFSLNAQFLPVPEDFVHGMITDTVLGMIHLAVCPAPATKSATFFKPSRLRGAALTITFDVFTGDMRCGHALAGGGMSESTPCAPALAAAGVTIAKEVSGCSAATMRCGFALEKAPRCEPRPPPSCPHHTLTHHSQPPSYTPILTPHATYCFLSLTCTGSMSSAFTPCTAPYPHPESRTWYRWRRLTRRSCACVWSASTSACRAVRTCHSSTPSRSQADGAHCGQAKLEAPSAARPSEACHGLARTRLAALERT